MLLLLELSNTEHGKKIIPHVCSDSLINLIEDVSLQATAQILQVSFLEGIFSEFLKQTLVGIS